MIPKAFIKPLLGELPEIADREIRKQLQFETHGEEDDTAIFINVVDGQLLVSKVAMAGLTVSRVAECIPMDKLIDKLTESI